MWNVLPFRGLKQFCWKSYQAWVRHRKKTVEIDGAVFELDLGEMIDLCVYLNRFEPDVTRAIDRFCQKGWCAFDIGANIGAHALRIANRIQPGGRLYAFEPTDFAYRKLVRNLSLNSFPHAEAIQVALSDVDRPAQPVNFRSSWRTDGTCASGPCTVDFVRLDGWCDRGGVRHVDLVKLDVDGNEFTVLSGGRSIFSACRPMFLMEVGAWHFANDQTNPILMLESWGYRFWDMKSLREYSSIQEFRRLLPAEDKDLSFSINVIAATHLPEPVPKGRV